MTAPKACEHCGAALDAGETCDCRENTAGQEALPPEETACAEDSGIPSPSGEDGCEANGNAMEFVMGDSLTGLPKTIDFNFEELKAALSERLAFYNGLVVTESGVKSAKEDRAKLNKLREALEAKRKEVKKACMAPYTDFEGRVKELVGLIDRPIGAIDAQIKAFDQQKRDAKRTDIERFFGETVGDLFDILPLSAIWRDEWLNSACTMKKIKEEIGARLERTRADLQVLSTVESEFMEPVKLKYLERLDVSEALAERSRLRDRAEKLRQYEAEQRKADQEEALRAARSGDTVQETRPPAPGETVTEERAYLLRFACMVTVNQARELSDWLNARNISFRRIRKEI